MTSTEAKKNGMPTSCASPFKRFVIRFAPLAIMFHRDISPGQMYIFRDHVKRKNPFEHGNKPLIVEVLEAKGCWIRYKHTNNSVWDNESMERDSFNFCFMLVDGLNA